MDFKDSYFGVALGKILAEQGRGSRTALSIDAHISEAYISQIISGKRKNVSQKKVLKICQALGKTYPEMIALGQDTSPSATARAGPTPPATGDLILSRLLGQYEERLSRIADS